MIEIIIHYRLRGATDWVMCMITPDEYYDLDADEEPCFESVERHHHARQYIDVPLSSLAETRIDINSYETGERRTILETFWGEGRHCLIERIDIGPDPYRELILCSEVQADPSRLEVIRLVEQAEKFSPKYHVIIESRPDGSEDAVRLLD